MDSGVKHNVWSPGLVNELQTAAEGLPSPAEDLLRDVPQSCFDAASELAEIAHTHNPQQGDFSVPNHLYDNLKKGTMAFAAFLEVLLPDDLAEFSLIIF